MDKKNSQMANKGQLFIVAAPSGGGKTSLVARLIQDLDDIAVSVSHTTREKRPGEIEGVHYFFIKTTEFNQMITRGEFVEHARVFDHHYGTSYQQINQRLSDGIDVVLDIDWQGALQIKRLFPEASAIYVIPPSIEALEHRLTARQQDNKQVILRRMQEARREMSHYSDFDYLIVNDDFDVALSELKAIVIAQRLTLKRQIYKQRKLLSFLLTTQ